MLISANAIPGKAPRSTARKKEVETATEIRLMDAGWWPTKGSASRQEYAGSTACARCHADQARTQLDTPMAHALTAASSTAFPEIAGAPLHFAVGPYNYELAPTTAGAAFSVSDGKETTLSAPVNWIFGNGQFGKTYVYEQNGSFYESRLSFYSAPKILDFTIGNPRSAPGRLEAALGRRMNPTEPAFCFGCHATAATTSNHFNSRQLIPGVGCEACHGPGEAHVAEMKLGGEESSGAIMNPAHLGPVDAVDFCGACHRTSVDVALSGVTGILTVRFPAYRLERSRCWKSGDARLTCTACHDPHQSLVRDSQAYDKNCVTCHSLTEPSKSTMPARSGAAATSSLWRTKSAQNKVCPVAQESCVTCHMPQYTIPEMHTTFTDHKIAIHKKDNSFVE